MSEECSAIVGGVSQYIDHKSIERAVHPWITGTFSYLGESLFLCCIFQSSYRASKSGSRFVGVRLNIGSSAFL